MMRTEIRWIGRFDQQVLGLQVAVEDSTAVAICDGVQELVEEAAYLNHRQKKSLSM